MRRALREMGMIEWLVWIVECIPGALVISLLVTFTASAAFDFPLAGDSWPSLLSRFVPGFLLGMAVMMAIGYFLGSLLFGILKLLGLRRD